ncbi:MAG: hypothetical protein WCF41_11360, partial [Pseudolabrys sp.]
RKLRFLFSASTTVFAAHATLIVAVSGHWCLRCKRLLLGVKRTWRLRYGINRAPIWYPLEPFVPGLIGVDQRCRARPDDIKLTQLPLKK